MNIEDIIKVESPGDDTHDIAYSACLRSSYDRYKDFGLEQLKAEQKVAQHNYDSTHERVATCMVLYYLIQGTTD